MRRPPTLRVELNSPHPRYACYVTDDVGTANGGFFKGFKSFDAMDAWLAKNGYVNPHSLPSDPTA